MINLVNNNGFKWVMEGQLAIKGYKESMHPFRKLNEESFTDMSHLVEQMKKSTGFFSVVVENEEFIFASVDRMRSIPLFYGMKNEELYLSDDARWIHEKIQDANMDKTAKAEFLMTGYVTGGDTLYPNVKQIQAGEYITFNKNKQTISSEHYFKLQHGSYLVKTNEELIEDLDQVHIKVFRGLIDSLNGRTAVLPLSGGYDSRLIAIMLKRLGYENVICFTYGKEGTTEAVISKLVAEQLEYKWIFIPYTKEKWMKWFKSKRKEKYYQYADGLSSIPHIQDVIAVEELKNKKMIPTDSVFIPGHALDFLAGSHIPEQFINNLNVSKEMIGNQLLNVHYSLWDNKKLLLEFKDEFINRTFDIIQSQEHYTSDEAADNYERWIWSERQSKFIAHSIRVYDFYNYEWRLPLWEKEIIEFWEKIPLENRYKRKFFMEYVNRKQPEFNYLQRSSNKKSNLIKKVIILFPTLYDWIIKFRKKKSLHNHPLEWYSIITGSGLSEKELMEMSNINSFLTHHYLETYEKRLGND